MRRPSSTTKLLWGLIHWRASSMYKMNMIWLHLGWVGAALKLRHSSDNRSILLITTAWSSPRTEYIFQWKSVARSLMAASTRVPVIGRRADFFANFAVMSRVRAPSVLFRAICEAINHVIRRGAKASREKRSARAKSIHKRPKMSAL